MALARRLQLGRHDGASESRESWEAPSAGPPAAAVETWCSFSPEWDPLVSPWGPDASPRGRWLSADLISSRRVGLLRPLILPGAAFGRVCLSRIHFFPVDFRVCGRQCFMVLFLHCCLALSGAVRVPLPLSVLEACVFPPVSR